MSVNRSIPSRVSKWSASETEKRPVHANGPAFSQEGL